MTPALLAAAWFLVLDTAASRRLTNRSIDRLVRLARADPDDLSSARELLATSLSPNEYTACRATAALGDLGEAAVPIVVEIAQRMDSGNPCVSQEAAKALSRLRPISKAALPQLVARIQKQYPDATT